MAYAQRIAGRTDLERFVAKIDKTDSCWRWTATLCRSGYGAFRVNGKVVLAHRYSYEQFSGPIPQGLELDHLCRHPWCVNPEHLEPVTRKVNNARGESSSARRGRQTHCLRGHEFNSLNTFRTPQGWRRCKACNRDRMREVRRVRV